MGCWSRSPEEILSQAIALRAAAYKRWREASVAEASPAMRQVYEQLATLECDRFDDLVRRQLAFSPPSTAPAIQLPSGGRYRAPRRAAAIAAEAERRTWRTRLHGTGDQAPERGLLLALVEDARRVRDLVGPGRRRAS